MLKFKYLSIFIVPLLFTPPSSNAQIGPILKNLIIEQRAVAKTVIRKETATIAKLSVSKNLSKGYKNNLVKFNKKYHLEDVIDFLDFGIDIFTNIEEIKSNDNKTMVYLNEILLNKNYPKLYQAICQKYKKDTLKKYEVEGILLGFKIKGIGIDSSKLYNLYFNYSPTFAKDELEKLKLYYNCDETVNAEINTIAIDKGIQLDTIKCKKKEETEVVDIIFTLFVLFCIGYFFWLIFKKIRNLFNKV